MEKTNTTNISDYIKVISGAIIFLIVGILLTSKSLNFSENTASLILQCFSLGLVLVAISFKGYYFNKPSNKYELPKKLLLFSAALIPTALIFFVNESYQMLFFYFSFFISICFMLVHGITFKREKENYLLTFLTSVWTLLGVVILVKHYKILPEIFFNELSFLHLDAIQTIRIILLIGIVIHIIIISLVEAIKPENNILEFHPIPEIPVPTEISSYHLLLLPIILIAYLATLFLNIGINIANLLLHGIIIILDSVLRFGQQIILSVLKLFYGWRSIIFFLFLCLACFSLPFIIKVNSEFLLSYIRGDNSDYQTLLSQIGSLLLATYIFRLLVTFQFCDIREGILIDNLFPVLNRKAYIDNFTPIVYCIVFYYFFISLTSFTLTGFSNYWNSFLQIKGYSSIGILTWYCGYIVVIAIIVVIPFIISKSKFAKITQAEEKSYFAFSKLTWSDFWSKSWVLVLFLLVCLAYYLYINGVPEDWFKDKSAQTSYQTIDNARIIFVQDSIELKKKEMSEIIRNDSIAKAIQFANLRQKQEKESQNSITIAKQLIEAKKKQERKKRQYIKPKERIYDYYQAPVVDRRPPYITQSGIKSNSKINSIYIVNIGDITIYFQLSVDDITFQTYSIPPHNESYFTFYAYSSNYYDQSFGYIKLCSGTTIKCESNIIYPKDRLKMEWDNNNQRLNVYPFSN